MLQPSRLQCWLRLVQLICPEGFSWFTSLPHSVCFHWNSPFTAVTHWDVKLCSSRTLFYFYCSFSLSAFLWQWLINIHFYSTFSLCHISWVLILQVLHYFYWGSQRLDFMTVTGQLLKSLIMHSRVSNKTKIKRAVSSVKCMVSHCVCVFMCIISSNLCTNWNSAVAAVCFCQSLNGNTGINIQFLTFSLLLCSNFDTNNLV